LKIKQGNGNMKFNKLPLGTCTFAEIIDKNLVYADKTKYIYNLLNSEDNCYFLSRPRGFGKTLLLSTIEELFSGNSQFFRDLWIAGTFYDFPKLPVILMSMAIDSNSPEMLKEALLQQLKKFCKQI
jgi:hypothetical protein